MRAPLLVAAALALGAWDTMQGDRAASGAGTGAFTNEQQLNLGKPLWR
jgi:hypothetical protein